jgi:polar amino acid transport system substrate-binding protein
MTANAMKGDRERCLAAGMDDYVSKPIEQKLLFSALQKVLKSDIREVTSQAPVRPDDPDIPKLQGIDLKGGMRCLGITWEAFRAVLLKAIPSQQAVLEALGTALDQSDWKAAERHAHSLAGAGGNIAANGLWKAAKQLESAVASENQKDVSELFGSVKREFAIVQASVAEIDKPGDADQEENEPAPSSESEPDMKQLGEMLVCLEEPLRRFDPKKSKSLMAEIICLPLAGALKQDMERLDKLIRKYRFKDAADMCSAIKKKLPS